MRVVKPLFLSTEFAKFSEDGINQLEQRCGETNISKTWSHVKVSYTHLAMLTLSSYCFCSDS